MDGRAWWATVHGVAKSRTRLRDFTQSRTHVLILKRLLDIISSNIFSSSLSLFFFWHPYNVNVGAFSVLPEVSASNLISFYYFFFILFYGSDLHYCLPAPSFVSFILLSISPSMFFIQVIIVHLCIFVI